MKETAWWMLVILGSAALVYDVAWYAGSSPHSMRLRREIETSWSSLLISITTGTRGKSRQSRARSLRVINYRSGSRFASNETHNAVLPRSGHASISRRRIVLTSLAWIASVIVDA